jgi:hypothetical protein
MKNIIILLFTFFSTSALGQGMDNDTLSTAGLIGSGVNELLGPKEILYSEFRILSLVSPCNDFKFVKLKISALQENYVRYIDSVDIIFHKEDMQVKIYSENNQYVCTNTFNVRRNNHQCALVGFNISKDQKKYIDSEDLFNIRQFSYKIIFKENIPDNKQLINRVIFDKLFIKR